MMGRMVLIKVVRDGSLEGLLYAQRHDEKREHVHDGETSLLGGGKTDPKSMRQKQTWHAPRTVKGPVRLE